MRANSPLSQICEVGLKKVINEANIKSKAVKLSTSTHLLNVSNCAVCSSVEISAKSVAAYHTSNNMNK